MKVLVDTSALLRYIDADDAQHSSVFNTVDKLFRDGAEVGVTPQVLRELWSVSTRPAAVNGLGVAPLVLNDLITDLLKTFELWNDLPEIVSRWRQLAVTLNVKGAQAHDTNLAAAALVHGATHVLTLNGKDFERFRPYGLEPIGPDAS